MIWRKLWDRTRGWVHSGKPRRREPPPCVGCRQPIDQLDPVEPIDATPSMSDSVIGPVPGLWQVVIDDQLVVLDRSTGRRVLLNATAALIFTAVTTPRSLADLIDQLASETGAAASTLADDVTSTVDRLLAQGMLTRDDLDPDRSAVVELPASEPAATADVDTSGQVWSYDSGSLALFGTTASVRAAESLEANLADLLAPVPREPSVQSAHRVDVVPAEPAAGADEEAGTDDGTGSSARDTSGGTVDDGTGESRVQVLVDGGIVVRTCRPGEVAMVVLDQLDRLGVQHGRGLRFHAGAVERDGDVVIVLGQSGDGKSTLTAALVQAGYGYLTDELAAVDPTTLTVLPYPRPLDLDATSRDALGVATPDASVPDDDSGRVKSKVSSARLGSVSSGGRAALIVLLAGPAGGHDEPPATITPLPPAEALMALLPVTFADSFDDERALVELARLCETTRTVRMTRGPLADMVAAIDAHLRAA